MNANPLFDSLASDVKSIRSFMEPIWRDLAGDDRLLALPEFASQGSLPSIFSVTNFATATIAVASLAVAELVSHNRGVVPQICVDRRLASFWFRTSLRPHGWQIPPEWDAIAGDYRGVDGWIKLHTNAPHHRSAALAVLGTRPDRHAVAAAVARWPIRDLEAAVVQKKGCAAAMRTRDEWLSHPQGIAVRAEPLIHRILATERIRPIWRVRPERPLQGIRVLDLTRILAGPVATRFLAGFGADVLRIDPVGWEEPVAGPEVTLGKHCARLDFKNQRDREVLVRLISEADVFVHGYRADALGRIGLDAARIREINPTLIDVSLDAYGWGGPWRERRGFDSLVQMSTGIAHEGMQASNKNVPVPLPAQALDHGTGYILAAAAVRGITDRINTGLGCEIRASLARTAELLFASLTPHQEMTGVPPGLTPEVSTDLDPNPEQTSWGPAYRVKSPVSIFGTSLYWSTPATALGSAKAQWHS